MPRGVSSSERTVITSEWLKRRVITFLICLSSYTEKCLPDIRNITSDLIDSVHNYGVQSYRRRLNNTCDLPFKDHHSSTSRRQQEFGSYLTENKLHLHYDDKSAKRCSVECSLFIVRIFFNAQIDSRGTYMCKLMVRIFTAGH